MKIEIRGHHFTMLPQKALYWHESETLLIADLHLGKITHFRKHGIALPSHAHANNLVRLDELISGFPVRRMYLLGDLFHHDYNAEWDRFAAWCDAHPGLTISIMLGNHDRLPASMLKDIGIHITDELEEAGFIFTHHPKKEARPETYVFCGHVHPVHCLRSGYAPALRLPCFVVDPQQAILPSFGVFTGGFEVSVQAGRRLFVVADREIFPV